MVRTEAAQPSAIDVHKQPVSMQTKSMTSAPADQHRNKQPAPRLLRRYLRLKWLAGFQIHINSAIVHTLAFFRLVPRGTQVNMLISQPCSAFIDTRHDLLARFTSC